MFVVGVVTAVTSVLGWPWMVAATVRSLAHLRSLKIYDTVPNAEVKSDSTPTAKEFVGVQEQRLTGLLIHALIGSAVIYCRPLLRQIPVAVLNGLFLYLGISSINQTDFFDRLVLFITDARDVAMSKSWAKNVDLNRTKLFTAIQAALLGAMWWIKGTRLGVFFPVLIGLLAPVRILLEKLNVFTKEELNSLDGEIA